MKTIKKIIEWIIVCLVILVISGYIFGVIRVQILAPEKDGHSPLIVGFLITPLFWTVTRVLCSECIGCLTGIGESIKSHRWTETWTEGIIILVYSIFFLGGSIIMTLISTGILQ